ncbi:tumor protein D53 isoform X1 [Xiphophorus couchianus]|uniref:tumor protein D53 isoform X1 n=1 Tax=Xiphophorus couchianus TaxID=32473 RepID=UPI0010170CAA|nr:tumor protein D53 isoform X1 [Xiphophorus couchianus]
METRQQELYSSVLSEAVVDWASMGPGEEWVNSATLEGELGLDKFYHSGGEESSRKSSHGEDLVPLVQNGENLTDWGHTTSHSEDQWSHTSGCQPDNWAMSTTWDMQLDSTERGHLTAGFLDSQPLREADEDLASEVSLNNSNMTEEEREEILQELTKLEEEISTLKQVLLSKEKQHAELKQKLGVTPLSEFRNNFSRGWHDMQSSTAYKKTSETLSTAGQKTSAAFSNFGSAITRKFGDMSMAGLELLFPRRSNSIGYSVRHSVSMPTMRNSPSFRSFEEKVENTVSTIKTKVGGTGTGGSFEEVLSSAANASSQETPTNNLTDISEKPC